MKRSNAMLLTKKGLVAILAAILAVWAISATAWLVVSQHGPKDPGRLLLWRMRAAGFEVNLVPPPASQGFASFADKSPALRHWLLSIVENPEEDLELRREALYAIVNMKNERAFLSAVTDMLDWLDLGASVTGKGRFLPAEIRKYSWLNLAPMDLPEKEVLTILKRMYPENWRKYLVSEANRADDEIRRGTEVAWWERYKARATRLLEYADAHPEGQPPTGPSPPASSELPGPLPSAAGKSNS